MKGALRGIAKNVLPGLKSGLGLQRCKKGTAPSPIARTLTKQTIAGPTAGNCGEFTWIVQWHIDKLSGAAGGYVVQTVDVENDIRDCANSPTDTSKKLFQEAWQINPGQTVTGYAETGDVNDDTYAGPSKGTATKGSIQATATAAYYDGLTLPADFIINNPNTFAGMLPSTTTIHILNGGTPTIPHNLTAEWDCCPSKTEKTKFTSTS
jgi:hypothetical protein